MIIDEAHNVVKFDEENIRLSLGIKQLTNDPWENIDGEFKVNEKYSGKIVNLNDNGIIISLNENFDGFVHLQDLSWSKKISHPSKIRVYPNPSNSKIYILGTSQKVEVYNLIGELVYGPFNTTTINISDWESGVYFVKSGLSVVKIIKH